MVTANRYFGYSTLTQFSALLITHTYLEFELWISVLERQLHGKLWHPRSKMSNNRRLICGIPEEQRNGQSLSNLQASHALLASRLDEMERRLQAAENQAVSSKLSFKSLSATAAHCTLIFVKLRAIAALHTGSKELGLRPSSLCAANTVVQTMIMSKPSDCALHEFQNICSELLSNSSICCAVVPSSYHAIFPNSKRTARLDVQFATFGDICNALRIDTTARERALYRERRNPGRSIRAVQLLGVEVASPISRKIILGESYPGSLKSTPSAYLLQRRPVWTQQAWESAFVFKNEVLPVLQSSPPIPASAGSSLARETTDDNSIPFDPYFAMTWERIQHSGDADSTIDIVPGKLYCSFPAVVLRSRLLIDSVRNIFTTRVNGKYPAHIVATAHHEINFALRNSSS